MNTTAPEYKIDPSVPLEILWEITDIGECVARWHPQTCLPKDTFKYHADHRATAEHPLEAVASFLRTMPDDFPEGYTYRTMTTDDGTGWFIDFGGVSYSTAMPRDYFAEEGDPVIVTGP